MEHVFQTLLEQAKGYEAPKARAHKDAKQVKKVSLTQLKEKMVALVTTGKVEKLKILLNKYPQIKKGSFWQKQAMRLAINSGNLEVVKLVLAEGAQLKTKNQYDVIWGKALYKNDLVMFKYLFDQGTIKWEETIQHSPYLFTYATKSPEITKLLMDHYGVDMGLVNLLNWFGKNSPQSVTHEYLAHHLIAGLAQLGLNNPELLPIEEITQQLKQTKLIEMYPQVFPKAYKLLWQNMIRDDRPDLMGKLIKLDLIPKASELIGLWYEAVSTGKQQSVVWLASSPSLRQQINQSWPVDPTQKGFYYRGPEESSLKNLQQLNELGLDLGANGKDDAPWIHGLKLSNRGLKWLAKTVPEIFASSDKAGKTLREKLTAQQKAYVEKALLKVALVSKQKPLRQIKQARKAVVRI